MGVFHASQTALIVGVILAGTFLGVINTLMTQLVMESAPVERPVASAAYSFVRFCGGAIAPFVAGKLAEHVSVASPFYLATVMTAFSVVVVWLYRDAFVSTRTVPAEAGHAAPAAVPVAAAPATATAVAAPLVVAVGGPTARQVSAMAVPLARARGAEVHVLHVVERDVLVGEDAAELETAAEARALLDACVAELRESGAAVTGELLESHGTHADVARQILRRAAELGAGAIVVGPDSRQLTIAAGVTARIASHAPAHVIVVNPRAGALGRPLAGVAGPADPATIWDGSNPGR
jgi:nucleotide-binding universal stress UspA family protein